MKYLKVLIAVLLFTYPNLFSQGWETIDSGRIIDISGLNDTLFSVDYGSNTMNTSYDKGNSWVSQDLSDFLQEDFTPLSIGFFNSDNGLLVATDITGTLFDLLRTMDGGISWESIYPLNNSLNKSLFHIVIINDSSAVITGFLNGDYVITFDKGDTWEENTDFTSDRSVCKFSVLNDSIFYNRDSNGIHRSENSGKDWVQLIDKEFVGSFWMESPDLGYAVYPDLDEDCDYLLKTTDGWDSYDSIKLDELNTKFSHLIAPINTQEIYVFHSDDVFRSTDGGLHFVYHQSIDFEPFFSNTHLVSFE